jgi:hypothetical protein
MMLAAIAGNVSPPQGRASPTLPAVAEVQREALAHARLDLAEVLSWRHRARQSALVPRVQIEYANRLRDTVDVNVNDNVYVGTSGVVVGPEEGSYKGNSLADHYVSVRAIWEFGDALFHPSQIAISAEARNVLRERNALLTEVDRRYFIVQSAPEEIALLRARLSEDPRPEKVRHEMFLRGVACEESSAALDGLTGGWWRGQLAEDAPICQPPVASGRKGGSR